MANNNSDRNRNSASQRSSNPHRPSGNSGGHSHKKKKRVPNYPRIIACALPVLLIICVIVIILRIQVWNKGKPYIITEEDIESIKLDTKDNIILMPPSLIAKDSDDGVTNVLILGNDSYSEGISDGSGIIDLFEKGVSDKVEIYNCSLPGSYLNAFNNEELSPSECPEDYFTLFWLAFNLKWKDFSKQKEALLYLDKDKYDIERYEEVISTLEGLDISNIDVVMFCYDGHDYRAGHQPINFNENSADAQTENLQTLLGAVYTSVYLFNYDNPNTQYVFVSPAFCYAIDDDNKKVSCAMYDTGYGTIEETFNAARRLTDYFGVSYIDLYSGVLINEDNADNYLEDDGITPNKNGRQMIADRLVTLLKDRLTESK
ncbi:MAG: hypothetical protein K5776_12790 [Lachnospiraceae bacterium]|nr:hypothetical protein [Lachnospiraceae bacterium]